MKNYKDISERVFRRGDEILEKRQRKTAVIKRISFSVSGLCAAAIISVGLWNNMDIKNAVNDNLTNDTQIIMKNDSVSETTTDFLSQNSTTECKNNEFDFSETFTTTVTSRNTVSCSTTSANEKTSKVPVSATTVTDKRYSFETTETQTESLQEIRQTTTCTTSQTNLTVTDTTTPPQNIDDERSFYMKKLTSFISAITLAAAATPITGNAVYNIDQSRYWPSEKEAFAKMDSGEFDVDIDGNGGFDVFDGYLLQRYCIKNDTRIYTGYVDEDLDSEIIQRIESIADYDGDGQVNYSDSSMLNRYLIVSGNVKREHLDLTYYDPDITVEPYKDTLYPKDVPAYSFVYDLCSNIEALLAGYDIVAEMYESGRIDLDFNGNGQLDVGDIYDFYVYDDSFIGSWDLMHTIPFDDWKRCDDAFMNYPCYFRDISRNMSNFKEYVTLYITGHIEMKPEYTTEEYYRENNIYRHGYFLDVRVRQAAERLGLQEDENAWLKLDPNEFNSAFDAYCNDVENGLRSAPDINMDGVIDCKDYFDSNIYFDDLMNSKSAEESILPTDVWNNLAENCDFNENGTSGDIYDITTVQLYVLKYTEEIENFNEAYKEYVSSLGANCEITADLNYENNMEILGKLDEKRSGDANIDGKVNMSDAVLIMQSIVNPDEFKLSIEGKFNADVYRTGDGVTTSDALLIQMWEIGMSTDIYELDFE